jgi:two-component system, LuxR family, sensor kinase FixL
MRRAERQFLEASARSSEELAHVRQDLARLAAIVESSDDAIIGKTLDGIITSWNKAAQRIFGYTAEELIGQHISRLIPPGREQEEPQILERLRLGERVDHFDTVRITKSGESVHVSLTISPIRDEFGQIVGASKIARDITERKRAAAASAAFEQRLQMAADAAKIGFWELDLTTNKLTRSPRHAELLGFPLAANGFDLNLSHLHPDDREATRTRMERALATGEEYINEFRVIWPDGSVHWLEERGRAVFDQTGKPLRMSGIVIDISERKEAEQKNRQRDAELAHLARVGSMGNIAAGLAHELSQPLAAVMNYAGVCMNVARTKPSSNPQFLIALEEVMNETRRAGAIISRLRAFVSKQAPRRDQVDLNDLIRKSISLLGFELRTAALQVDLRLAANLKLVLADEIQIQQVMVNLICNAIQAMTDKPAPQRRLTIETRRLAENFAQASVTDTGKGMPAEDLARLFEPFFTTKPDGLGIGLNISRSIVTSHGGCLGASPNPGGGMRFAFTLPEIAECHP